MPEDEFGYGDVTHGGEAVSEPIEEPTDIDTGKTTSPGTGEDPDDISSVDDKSTETNNEDGKETEEGKGDKDSEALEPGTVLEVGEDKYTVDDKGNLVDKDGKIFKKAEEVAEWRKSFEEEEDVTDELSIESIQKALDVEITDENDKPVVFDNTPEGVKEYINAVLETGREEQQKNALDTLFARFDFLPDLLNYYVANGNSLQGYGQRPDRSKITIDSNNEEQQIFIIKSAWQERGQRGDVNGYIDYLKSSGTLLATAEEELKGLQEADKAYKEETERKAAEAEKQHQAQIKEYWNGVKQAIDNKEIAGYRIPDNIIINKNGTKVSVTPDDFFNYLYMVDKEGHSAYERDLMNTKPEDRLNDELLRAFLTFTGGSYANLVDYAINEKNVKTLRLKAAQRERKSTLRISKPSKVNLKETDFGY